MLTVGLSVARWTAAAEGDRRSRHAFVAKARCGMTRAPIDTRISG